jgi:shikimate kinase
MPPRYVLIGPPGAGKSTIGAMLARRLGVGFVDTDKTIVAKVGKPISDLFVLDGEDAFRAIERVVVTEELQQADGVLALGGGSILNEQTQRDIHSIRATGSRVVFVDVSIAKAAPRIGFNRSRPLLLGNPRAQWLALMQVRRPIYEALADLTVDTSDQVPQRTVDAIISNWAENQ